MDYCFHVKSDLMDSIVIEKIDTKAMEMAVLQGQTPFALYKPAKGIPILVKVSSTANNKHVSIFTLSRELDCFTKFEIKKKKKRRKH